MLYDKSVVTQKQCIDIYNPQLFKQTETHYQMGNKTYNSNTTWKNVDTQMTDWRSLWSLITPRLWFTPCTLHIPCSTPSVISCTITAPSPWNLIPCTYFHVRPAGARPLNWAKLLTWHHGTSFTAVMKFPTRANQAPSRQGSSDCAGGFCNAYPSIPLSLSSVMIMSCVVCLFRLKVISFAAFSSLPSALAP